MTLKPDEFIRRFLLHVLPKGFHRIRHYGLLASATCKTNIARARELIATTLPSIDPSTEQDDPHVTAGAATDYRPPCPCCGGRSARAGVGDQRRHDIGVGRGGERRRCDRFDDGGELVVGG
jgi:hypothetical protein